MFFHVEKDYMNKRNEAIGRFIIEKELSAGGMSEIYEVRDVSLKAKWIMKVIDNEDESKTEAAKKEIEILKSVSHPSIPRIVDCYADGKLQYVIMDYIDGYNLKKVVSEIGGFKEKDAVNIGIKLSQTLSYLHSKGIIYRDLKPSNIMITKEGYIRLVDFGIAAFKDEKNNGNLFYATKEYAPPELLEGECGDERSDIYELGATLLAICAKKKSRGFKYFCKKCMKKKSGDRFESADEATLFLKNLDKYKRNCQKDYVMASIWFSMGILILILTICL